MADQSIKVPNIGDAHDVDVVEVLVQAGARVEREQALIVLETDKASMEIPSPRAGVVRKLSVTVGDKVSAGSEILVLDTDEAAVVAPVVAAPPSVQPAAADAVSVAQPAAADAVPVPAAADPAALPVLPRPPAAARDQTRTIPPAPSVAVSMSAKLDRSLPHASPAIRRFARELGVDLTQVAGSGLRGRITKQDVEGFVKHALSVATKPVAGGFAIPDAPEIDFTQFGDISVQPLTKIQRVSGKNLHRSWVTIPHVTQFDEADITELEAFRKKLRADDPELKLTPVTFFMKALVVALKAMPRFNASLDKSGENLILKHYFHIGVAVDTPNGLMVPVIRDVDIKGLAELAKELEDVSERARARRLGPADLQGASMTISSLGGIGGTAFTPIINPPEVAVLGVSRAVQKPVYQNGTLVPRLICPLSLSYDHRVVDGADAARFTTRLGEILGDIRQMLL
ncbi:MAG TPA: 2-oxo acid dehydrogenase subunit E2 [Polyangiales bacterium]